MFCKKCGNGLIEGTEFCSKCGAPVGEVSPKENSHKVGKETLIVAVLALLIGTIGCSFVTYSIMAQPVREELGNVKQLQTEVDDLAKEENTKLVELYEKYAELSGFDTNMKTPSVTKLRGYSRVGTDIAPGTYIVENKEDPEDDLLCRVFPYSDKEEVTGYYHAEAQEEVKVTKKETITFQEGDVIYSNDTITFTPVKENK